jgi:ABC-type uncharacterized transport system YnjBCD ATPase subunit
MLAKSGRLQTARMVSMNIMRSANDNLYTEAVLFLPMNCLEFLTLIITNKIRGKRRSQTVMRALFLSVLMSTLLSKSFLVMR